MRPTRHIFLTPRQRALEGWAEAFPLAEVLPYPEPGTVLVSRPGEALVWFHFAGGQNGCSTLCRTVCLAAPGCRVVVLSNAPDQAEGLVCLEAGAVGYAHALAGPQLLHQVADVVAAGGLWVGPDLIARLRTALTVRSQMEDASQRIARLSPREREVALAVAGGASNKEVARHMGITERTVKAHLSAIFERLGVRDRLQLTVLVNGGGEEPRRKEYAH